MAGNIRKLDERRFYVRVCLGYDARGKRNEHRKVIHGTRKDAQRYLNGVLRDLDLGRFSEPTKISLNDHLDEWLETVAKQRVRTVTYESYRSLLASHVRPALGNVRLDQLASADIQALYARMTKGGLSPRTVRYAHAVLHSALKQAIRWQRLSSNPSDYVDLPRQVRTERPVITAEALERFMEAASNDRWGALFLFALATGMRPGEYQALKWEDVDMNAGIVTVRRSLEPLKGGGWKFNEPKTARSRRSITLPKPLLPILQRHRARQAEERLAAGSAYQDNGLVFASLIGSPVDRRNLANVHFRPLLRAAGLPEAIRLYDLRHSCATILLAAGKNPKIVAERLGHASTVMTMDVYSHVTPTMQREAADALEAMMFGAAEKRDEPPL